MIDLLEPAVPVLASLMLGSDRLDMPVPLRLLLQGPKINGLLHPQPAFRGGVGQTSNPHRHVNMEFVRQAKSGMKHGGPKTNGSDRGIESRAGNRHRHGRQANRRRRGCHPGTGSS